MNVVIITLDSHLRSAAERARKPLGKAVKGLNLSLHAAAEWADNENSLVECREDIAKGDIIIVTMLVMEDHINAVLPYLRERNEDCDAMVCCMSSGEVMKLTRMGRFSMSAPQSGPLALIKKLRGKGKNKNKIGA